MKRRIDIDGLYEAVATLTTRHTDGRSRTIGLIAELHDVTGRILTQAGQSEGGRAGKPGSKPPSADSHGALDLLAEMETGVWELDCDLRDQLDAHLDYDRHWLTALAAIPGLVNRLPDAEHHQLAATVDRTVQHWCRRAQLQLRHMAPMRKLQHTCPYCEQQSLVVRSDASTDVYCTTDNCEDERGERPRWTRDNWALLLGTA